MKARLINKIEKELAVFTEDRNSIKNALTKIVRIKETCSEACDGHTFIRITPTKIMDSNDYPNIGIEGDSEFEEVQMYGDRLKELKPVSLKGSRIPILETFYVTVKDNKSYVIHTNLKSTVMVHNEHEPIEYVDDKSVTPTREPDSKVLLSVDGMIKLLQLLKKNKAYAFTLSMWSKTEPIKIESNSLDNDIMALVMTMKEDGV